MRVVVLGAGFGGLELTARLSDAVGDDLDCVLIDQADAFVFGYSKLDLLYGKASAEAIRIPYRDIKKPGVRFQTGSDRVDRSCHAPRGDRPRDVRGRCPRGGA